MGLGAYRKSSGCLAKGKKCANGVGTTIYVGGLRRRGRDELGVVEEGEGQRRPSTQKLWSFGDSFAACRHAWDRNGKGYGAF